MSRETEPDVVASTRISYGRIAAAYADNHTDSISPDVAATRARLADALPDGATVADLGCGPGRDLRWFAGQGLDAIGVDASLEMLSLVAADGVRLLHADLGRLPIARGSLDGIWCSAALLHVPKGHVAETLRGFRRVLRAGGMLALVTPVGDEEGWELVPYDPLAQAYDHPVKRWFSYHLPSELTETLASLGLRVTHETTVHRFKPWWHAILTAEE